jgi:hypothetical protein
VLSLQSLGENVCGIGFSHHPFQLKRTLLIPLPDKVIVHIHVLGASVQGGISSQEMRAEVVA